MQLKTADLLAVKSTGLLPVFGYALLLALLVGLSAGGFVAWKWKSGAAAISQNKELKANAAEWKRIAEEQRQIASDNALQFQAALNRLGEISQGREDDRETLRQFMESQRSELQKLFAADPALRSVDAGPDFLRHWNKGNAGPAAAPATTEPAGQPAPAVPGTPAGTQQQPVRPGSEPRRSDGAVPRLPQQPRAAAAGGGRVAGHRVALVLHGGKAGRHRHGRMSA